ncbi:MAG: hypothetical protein ACO1SX_22215 [Actinomycetota bacterium]
MHCPNCRVALAPNSRFCNTCGAAATPGAAPGGDRTGAYSGQTLHGQPGPARHESMPPTYQVPSGTPPPGAYHSPPPAPSKKPVALLVAVMLLIAVGVLAGGVMMFQKSRNAVTGGQMASTPQAPGLQQAPSAVMPNAPGVVAAPNRPVTPGQPVTAGPQTPKDDGMAPSVVMAPGSQAPGAPSVTLAPGVQAPAAPPVTAAPPQPGRPSAPMTAAPNRAQPPPQAPPPPPNNNDLDRYVLWLQYVEQERQGLRAMGETESFRMIEGFYQTALGLADPDSNDAMIQQQFNQNLMRTLNNAVFAARKFQQNVISTKPKVPSDCLALDQYYMAAMKEESEQTVMLLNALVRKDIGQIKRIGNTASGRINKNLGMANLRLEQVYRGRGLNQQFRIETGGNASMLGGMMGMGGMGGL